MKTIMMAACAALALSSCGGRKTEAPPADAPAALKAIADDYLAAELKVYPFAVVYAGVGDVVNEDYAAMEDNSPETLARLQRIEDELYARLMKLGAAGFAGADWVLYETLKKSPNPARTFGSANSPCG